MSYRSTPLIEINGGTNQTSYTTGDMIYASGTNTLSKLAIGTGDGSLLGVNSGIPTYLNPLKYFNIFDDLEFPSVSGNNVAMGARWTNTVANSGTTLQLGSDSAHPGVIVCSTINVTNGAAGIKMYNNTGTDQAFNLGGGTLDVSWYINLSALSNGTDTYTVRVGVGNANSTSAPSNGIYFTYSSTGSTPNWQINTTASSVTSTADSGVAAAATTWTNLRVTSNAAGTSISFFINGVQTSNSPISTNIPTARIAPFAIIIKSAGTTVTTMSLDYCRIYQVLTTSRT